MKYVIPVPDPPADEYAAKNTATEFAFNELMRQAKASGLPIGPVMGLMYLPTQELTRNFQTACRAILDALKPS